jgi:hypothetical protein
MDLPVRHSRELLLKLFFAHGAAELACDVEGVMNTLCDNPVYEYFPCGLRVEGRDAVREFYSRVLPRTIGSIRIGRNSGNHGDLDTPDDVLWMGPHSMVTRDDLFVTGNDGVERDIRSIAIFTLAGKRLLGESIYTTAEGGRRMMEMLGEDFLKLPGVSLIV